MAISATGHESSRLSIQERLRDPIVHQGYVEQGAVLDAAALIRRMRGASGLTQVALAARVGTSQAHLSMLERGVGRHGPTFLMLRKIAQACGQELRFSVSPSSERPAPAPRPTTYAATFRGIRFRPLHDRIIVRRVDPAFRTAAGIIIPDTAQEKPVEGEVLAVGPGYRTEQGELVPIAIAAGEHILFGKWSGTEVTINGEELLIMKEADIIGVVDASARDRKKTQVA